MIECFKGRTELVNLSPLRVSLLFDDTEVELFGDNRLTSQFVYIMDISPSPHFFIGTVDRLELKLSHNISYLALSCIMIPFAEDHSKKITFNALVNDTQVFCPFSGK